MSQLEIYTNSKNHKQYVRPSQGGSFIPEEHALYHIIYETKKGILYEVKVNGNVGLVNRNGRIIVPIKYYSIESVFDNCFSGKENKNQKGYALIKFDGTKITDFVWKSIYGFYDVANNLVIVEDFSYRKGYLNIRTGKIVVPTEYTRLIPFKNGIAGVSTDYKYWGAVNEKGKLVVKPIYMDVVEFDGAFAIARRYGLEHESFSPVYVVLSKTGAEVVKNPGGRINKIAENTFEALVEVKKYGGAETKRLFFLKDDGDCTLVKEVSQGPTLLIDKIDRYIINSNGVKLSNEEISARVKRELG